MSEKRKVRTIVIDGIEIQTDLHAVEIADLPKKLAEVEKENKKYKEVIDKAIAIIDECKLLMPHEFDCGEQIEQIEKLLKEVE